MSSEFNMLRQSSGPRRRDLIGIAAGVAVGALVALAALSTTIAPTGSQWPSQKALLSYNFVFTARSTSGIGILMLGAGCTQMLLGLNSSVPLEVWVAPFATPVNLNNSPPVLTHYYWSGTQPVEQLRVTFELTNPGDGFSVGMFDLSYTSGGNASWGFAFSDSDCLSSVS